jgi:prepilin-type N-terminal cleavage/methylation domain-containing protein
MSWRARAFALVELLIVIAVIAVLIAILLPSISAARQRAHRTVCQNNLRQLGISIQVYLGDYRRLPAATPGTQADKGANTLLMATRATGLMALPRQGGFTRRHLACPEGWASGGVAQWYDAGAFNNTGAAYMDYTYWAGRYPPIIGDIRSETFQYRAFDTAIKMVATDTVVELASGAALLDLTRGGNHVNPRGGPEVVQKTNGRGGRLDEYNFLRSRGMSALFSDNHVQWFPAERLTQSTDGLAYPPRDQW